MPSYRRTSRFKYSSLNRLAIYSIVTSGDFDAGNRTRQVIMARGLIHPYARAYALEHPLVQVMDVDEDEDEDEDEDNIGENMLRVQAPAPAPGPEHDAAALQAALPLPPLNHPLHDLNPFEFLVLVLALFALGRGPFEHN